MTLITPILILVQVSKKNGHAGLKLTWTSFLEDESFGQKLIQIWPHNWFH